VPVSVTQRQVIVTLLKDGLGNQEIATQVGVTPGTVAAVKAHISMGTYGESCEGADAETEVASAVDTAFGLERDLQMALRRNIEQLETGLTIIDGDREQTVASGRIDITARDREGVTVIIELKVGAADRDAIGQLLGYMGDLMDDGAPVRGVLVAREFAPRAVSAARAVPNLELVRYGFQFTFEAVTGSHVSGRAAAPRA
jgi:Endonuclease NucS